MWTKKPFWPGFCAWRRPCLRPGARLAAGMCAAVLVMTVQGCSFPSSGAEIPPLPVLTSLRKLELNGRAGLLPDAAMGYAAAKAASAAPVAQGSVGAGAGARCGRLFFARGEKATQKCGLGSAVERYDGILVAALTVVNALGNIHDPRTGVFLAGGRREDGTPFSEEEMRDSLAGRDTPPSNTVLTVVATNVPLDKVQTSRLARMAGTGLARCLRPAHLTLDGDIVFALSSRRPLPAAAGPWTENLLGALGADAVARAVVAAAEAAAGDEWEGGSLV